MTNLHIANAAIFFAIAVMHVCRLSSQVPVSIGSYDIPLWLSAVAIVGALVLAWFNWRAIHKPGKAEGLKFLLALFVIDAVVSFFFWQLDVTYWGVSGNQFAWVILFDLVVAGLIHWSLNRK